ncbi:MAG: YeeE/YedE family protein [bacterium]
MSAIWLKTLLLGLPIGLLFGYVLQRGRFCMYTAFRDILIARDATLFRAYILALLVQAALIHALAAADLLSVQVFSFTWLASIAGSFVFGIGMVLAGGCSSGTWYRVGEGMVGSWMAAMGYALGVAATFWGLLRPAAAYLRSFRAPPELSSLHGALGLPKWAVLIALLAAGGIWLARSPRPRAFTGWTWTRTGLAIGLVAALAWVASAAAGRNFGLSMTGPSGALLRYVAIGDTSPGWGLWMILGVPLGAFAGAVAAGEFKWRAPAPERMVKQFAGGGLMGFGAATAGGCNIGHSLTGLAALSTGSLAATIFIILGCWTGTYLFFMRK